MNTNQHEYEGLRLVSGKTFVSIRVNSWFYFFGASIPLSGHRSSRRGGARRSAASGPREHLTISASRKPCVPAPGCRCRMRNRSPGDASDGHALHGRV
jgi:hypothetical protein